jgi:hypothetical protein
MHLAGVPKTVTNKCAAEQVTSATPRMRTRMSKNGLDDIAIPLTIGQMRYSVA